MSASRRCPGGDGRVGRGGEKTAITRRDPGGKRDSGRSPLLHLSLFRHLPHDVQPQCPSGPPPGSGTTGRSDLLLGQGNGPGLPGFSETVSHIHIGDRSQPREVRTRPAGAGGGTTAAGGTQGAPRCGLGPGRALTVKTDLTGSGRAEPVAGTEPKGPVCRGPGPRLHDAAPTFSSATATREGDRSSVQARTEGMSTAQGGKLSHRELTAAVLTGCDFVSRATGQRLKTFLVVTTGGGKEVTGISWAQIRDAATHPHAPRTAPATTDHPWAQTLGNKDSHLGSVPPKRTFTLSSPAGSLPPIVAWCSFRLVHPPLPAKSPLTFRVGPHRDRSEPVRPWPPDCPHASLATVDPRKCLPPISVILA